MLTKSQIGSWQHLLTHLEITDENHADAIPKIQKWCRQQIKSSITNTRLNEFKKIIETYNQLNNADSLNTMIDKEIGYTVAHKAAKLGFDRFLDLSLSLCSEPASKQILTTKTLKGNTPLHLAAMNGDVNTVETLIEEHHADANLKNHNNKSALDLASQCAINKETKTCVALLLIHTSHELYDSALILDLIAFNDPLLLDSVFKRNPDLIKSRDELGQNVLHNALITNCDKVVDYLLEDKELMEQSTDNNSNVFHLACRYSSKATLDKLLENKAIPEHLLYVQDANGLIPLDYLKQRTEFKGSIISSPISMSDKSSSPGLI
ncbi:MAG: ankyrin repeat domain-containing protein [Gammaproteobacteria bacterium]|nr:ankyrin repeat domain-containing protein [Gammaproteobacteria bacterium]